MPATSKCVFHDENPFSKKALAGNAQASLNGLNHGLTRTAQNEVRPTLPGIGPNAVTRRKLGFREKIQTVCKFNAHGWRSLFVPTS